MKKGICAVSVLCIFFAVLLFASTGCSAKAGDEREAKSDGKAGLLRLDETIPITEKIYKVSLEDSGCRKLIGMDEAYYYLTNDDEEKRIYIRAKRKTGSITEIASIENKWKDWTQTLQYGYRGDVYVGLWKGEVKTEEGFTGDYDKLSSPGVYRIVRLSRGKPEQEIFRYKTMGFPQAAFAGNHIALEINSGKSLRFTAIDLKSGKETEIFRSSFERKENGNFSGDILMGMEYSRAVPAAVENGICYQTCTLKDESMSGAKAGDNQFVFYDFQSGKNRNLGKHYRPVEYVGGTENMYFTLDYPSDLSGDPETFYLRDEESGTWRAYGFEREKQEDKEALSPFPWGNGTGLLDENTMAVYSGSGFYIIDAKNKTYLYKTYTTDIDELDEEELQRSYVESVTGMTYGDSTFAFSTGQGNEIEIHEITKE